MKKLICICLSLIMLASFSTIAFADEVTYLDTVSGDVIDARGDSFSVSRITATCKYDSVDKMYIYSTGPTSTTDVACSVFDGMVTTDPVVITLGDSAKIEVFRSGVMLDSSEFAELSAPGSYVVNNPMTSSQLFTFTIVPRETNAISMYRVPAVFYIASAKVNNQDLDVRSNTVTFDQDGLYHIDYSGKNFNANYSLDVKVDVTYPELEIFGVDENGVANGPVTFGPLEPNSTLEVTVDGTPIDPVSGEYVTAGQYVVKYTDKAGNTSTYYFKMNLFFNISAVAFLIMVLIVLALAVGYTIFIRKNRRVR